jgi:hypothetical protein
VTETKGLPPPTWSGELLQKKSAPQGFLHSHLHKYHYHSTYQASTMGHSPHSTHPMIFMLTTRYHWMSLTFQQMHCLFLVAFCPLWCGSQNGTSYKEKYVTKDVRIRPNLSRASMWSIPVTTKLDNVSPGYECGATPQGKCEGTEVAKCPFSSSSGCGAAIVPLT